MRQARLEEMEEVRKRDLYEVVDESECWRSLGTEPIGTRWVDVNKGAHVNPEYRSRRVAQDIKREKREELFAATPPLEALNIFISMSISQVEDRRHDKAVRNIEFIDVRRADFHATVRRILYVQLPAEANAGQGTCGRLKKAMDGTHDAAQNGEAAYTRFMESVGFRMGVSTPCVFFHGGRDMRVVLHGDDFTILGKDTQLDWFRGEMKKGV